MNWESKILTRNPSGIQNLQSYSWNQRHAQIFKIYSIVHLTHSKFKVILIGTTICSNFQNSQYCPWDLRPVLILALQSFCKGDLEFFMSVCDEIRAKCQWESGDPNEVHYMKDHVFDLFLLFFKFKRFKVLKNKNK